MNWVERDKEFVWHPFTQMKTAQSPIVITSGKGALLFDEYGNEYIDAVSSWWVNVHGHAHPYIAKMVNKQLQTLEHAIFAGFSHPWAIELSERVIGLLPSSQAKVFFSDNGSTAVEVAIKMAIQYWWNLGQPRNKIVAFNDAYHGDTFGAMAVGERGIFNKPFHQMMFEVRNIDHSSKSVIEEFKQILLEEDIAAFIFEPLVQGAGGMLMYDEKVLDQLIEIAQANNVICIADEVMTGFWRTGKMFASNYLKSEPDIFCLSKALTGGTMPLSLTTCNSKIYEAFLSEDKLKTFFHGHSYTANPTACAAALASLDLFEKEETLNNIERINQRHKGFIKKLKDSGLPVSNIRLRGTIVAFDVIANSDGYLSNIRDFLYDEFIKRNVLLRPLGNTVYILPPYVISDEQLYKVYTAIFDVLNQVSIS